MYLKPFNKATSSNRPVPSFWKQKFSKDVVEHEDVGVAVLVVVGTDHAHPLARIAADPRLGVDVGERAVAVVAVQRELCRADTPRGRRIPDSRGGREPTCVVVGELEIIGHEQIQIAVAVGIQEAGPAPASRPSATPAAAAHVGERPVAVVPVQDFGAEIADVQIGKPVLVVVRRRRPPCRTRGTRPRPASVTSANRQPPRLR